MGQLKKKNDLRALRKITYAHFYTVLVEFQTHIMKCLFA